MALGSFRLSVFDPYLVVAQIAAMQAAFYASLSILILFGTVLTGTPISLDHVLAYHELVSTTATGWMVFIATLLNAGAMCIALVLIVQRAKLVLDFACTLYGLHLAVSVIYNDWRLPDAFMWYLANLLALVIVAMGGEQLCMQRELEPIAVGVGMHRTGSNSGSANSLARKKSRARAASNGTGWVAALGKLKLPAWGGGGGAGAGGAASSSSSSGAGAGAWPLQQLWGGGSGAQRERLLPA
ncbi:hypothetical protein AMAG_16228 [Allomyces macrogynus ATCC 38327]|uniref:Integral membrane protein n=1 Tax=Allomyces macrogynus (strain ATCC 38327) TaxID=578462 RepID=A0A0L0TAU3_ALLM3|nr:hypothetical protein, variant [Allomyces macrogynus ATCC 38327]KNE71675.1 hypothetical protein AMAG_16228 [Allomyces macrogynus ATCC 38327]|eukprot:KNE71674.1 hypothetical protein, variant [Allomyces macrogynus ATCC 38327]